MTSQADAIALYLESGHELTPLEALSLFGTMRLAARIRELRSRGLPIETLDREQGGKHFAAYRLRRPVQQTLFAPTEPEPYGFTVPAVERAGASPPDHVGHGA